MKKLDRIPREVLYQVYEHGDRFFKQKDLAKACDLSLGTINPFIQKMVRLGILERKPQGFRVVDTDRFLTYWGTHRELYKDVIFSTYVPRRVDGIETDLPAGAIVTAYTGYKKYFDNIPTNYSKVYIYSKKSVIKKRFEERPQMEPNLIVLDNDEHLKKRSIGDKVPLSQLYVDLWQLGRPANRFINELKNKLSQRTIRGLEKIAQKFENEK